MTQSGSKPPNLSKSRIPTEPGIQTLEDYNPPDDPKWVKTPKPSQTHPKAGFLPKTGIQTLEDYNPPDDPKWVKTPKPARKRSKRVKKWQMGSKVANRVAKEKRTQCAPKVCPRELSRMGSQLASLPLIFQFFLDATTFSGRGPRRL